MVKGQIALFSVPVASVKNITLMSLYFVKRKISAVSCVQDSYLGARMDGSPGGNRGLDSGLYWGCSNLEHQLVLTW